MPLGYKWDFRFLDQAKEVSNWSKDPSTKVGAIIIDKNKIPRSFGWNGLPRGVVDDITLVPERYQRPQKYMWIRHAESNAISNCASEGISTKDCIMYITHPPCAACAGHIIGAGIAEVIVDMRNKEDLLSRWADEIKIAIELFNESGVKFWVLRGEELEELHSLA